MSRMTRFLSCVVGMALLLAATAGLAEGPAQVRVRGTIEGNAIEFESTDTGTVFNREALRSANAHLAGDFIVFGRPARSTPERKEGHWGWRRGTKDRDAELTDLVIELDALDVELPVVHQIGYFDERIRSRYLACDYFQGNHLGSGIRIEAVDTSGRC